MEEPTEGITVGVELNAYDAMWVTGSLHLVQQMTEANGDREYAQYISVLREKIRDATMEMVNERAEDKEGVPADLGKWWIDLLGDTFPRLIATMDQASRFGMGAMMAMISHNFEEMVRSMAIKGIASELGTTDLNSLLQSLEGEDETEA